MRRPAIGILLLDYEYSGVPGGLQDHTALEYETRVATVRGLTFEAAKSGAMSPGLEAAFRDAVDELQTGGGGDLVGISGNCGFMMFYQELVRGLAGVPVFMSPLLQAPLVAGALPPSGIILVLTASKADLMAAKEVLLTKAAIRVDDRDQVPRARNSARNSAAQFSAQFSDGRHAPSSQFLIEGLDDLDGFECVADPTRGAMDQQKVERGIVARVTAILRRTPVRAILCECTELPAFSDALRTATSLPVFDVVTCLDFFHSARNRSFHSAVRHHVTQGIERKLSSEAETAVLPPVRTATNTLRDDARAITRNQLELALGAVNYFERELLIDPLESEVSDVTGRNVTATVWSRLQMLARVVPLLRGATTTETINEVPLATLDIDVADLWKSYLPLALALHKKRQAHAAAQAAAGTDEAFVVGLNAPPGCGKSTLVQLLRTLLRAAAANDDDGRQGSLVVAHVGSDDLYMTQEQRREAGIPSRLDARSIDGSLADSVLWALKRSTAESEVAIPRFNKGLDEREDPKLWTVQRGKVDVVLFEGWRVGVNHPAYARFNEAIDLLVCLDADEEAIKEWKVQSSRRDAVVAGKPFDEAAVRRAFDELIMPFVTIYEKPLLARADPLCLFFVLFLLIWISAMKYNSQGKRNRTPAYLHAPWVEATPKHQPDSSPRK